MPYAASPDLGRVLQIRTRHGRDRVDRRSMALRGRSRLMLVAVARSSDILQFALPSRVSAVTRFPRTAARRVAEHRLRLALPTTLHRLRRADPGCARRLRRLVRNRKNRQKQRRGILMSILVNKNTRVICQGFTGSQGTFHSEQAIAYGTQDGRRRDPRQGRRRRTSACPSSTRVHEAVAKTGANATVDLRARRPSPPTRSSKPSTPRSR